MFHAPFFISQRKNAPWHCERSHTYRGEYVNTIALEMDRGEVFSSTTSWKPLKAFAMRGVAVLMMAHMWPDWSISERRA